MREPVLRYVPDVIELWHLERHQEADALPRAPLHHREHPFPDAGRIASRGHDVGKAVDDDAFGARRVREAEQLVHPLADADVDHAAPEDVDAACLQRPAKATDDAPWLG